MNKKGCNLKKILIGVSVGVMILASVVGVYLYVNRFDASKYVQAVLDVSYKNKTTLYQEVADVSEKEAKAVFEKNLDATMQGFDASDMPDSLKGKYRELFGEIAKKVNYTVGEAQKEKDGTYIVSVKVTLSTRELVWETRCKLWKKTNLSKCLLYLRLTICLILIHMEV